MIIDNAISQTLDYFLHFDYPPTIDELRTFLQIETHHLDFQDKLDQLEKEKKIFIVGKRVTVDKDTYKRYLDRLHYSLEFMAKAKTHITILRYLPFIKLLAISGSLSMMNADNSSDIDIFIITKAQNIWTARFFVLVYKKMLSLLYPKIGKNLCFNLFFAENGLEIGKKKQNPYVGHEILQMKVVFQKEEMYDKLLSSNQWMSHIFPNVQIKSKKGKDLKNTSQKTKGEPFFDKIIEKVQKIWLKQKGYKWKEEQSQLWLIQEDFEKKIKW